MRDMVSWNAPRMLAVAAGLLVAGLLAPGLLPVEGNAQTIDWRIRIERREAARIPLWVERLLLVGDLTRLEPVAREIEGILVDDLELSGHFRVTGQLAADLAGPGSSIPRSKGKEILATVEGRLEESAGVLSLTGRLSDFPEGKLIGEWVYPVTPETVREVVHTFADRIVLQLTGEPGVARTRLACVCRAADAREIHVVDYDGHGLRALTHDGSTDLAPAWSPVDPLIAYTSFKRGEADLFAVNAESGASYTISRYPGLDTAPSWSPDGRWLAVTLSRDAGNPEIYLIRRNGEIVRRLTHHPGIDSSPCFAPTGRQIAFMSDRTGSPQLFLMDTDGLNVRRLPITQSYADSPAWSPRGDRIAYAAWIDGHFDIFVVRVDGTDEVRLTEGPASNENPRWSPDGRQIVFSAVDGRTRSVQVMHVDGTGKRRVTPEEMDCFYPAWSPAPPAP